MSMIWPGPEKFAGERADEVAQVPHKASVTVRPTEADETAPRGSDVMPTAMTSLAIQDSCGSTEGSANRQRNCDDVASGSQRAHIGVVSVMPVTQVQGQSTSKERSHQQPTAEYSSGGKPQTVNAGDISKDAFLRSEYQASPAGIPSEPDFAKESEAGQFYQPGDQSSPMRGIFWAVIAGIAIWSLVVGLLVVHFSR